MDRNNKQGVAMSTANTVLNPDVNNSKATSINQALSGGNTLEPGETLCEKYKIISKMDVVSGEADLYICSRGRGKYVAKVYRRPVAIKAEVSDALAGVYSPYVAQIFDMGDYNGFPVEILPYYANGSLQGKKFSFDQLKKDIIPALNEGLKVLHENGIIHKDLKPSNIMLNADGRTVSIIDFGISSIREGNATVIVTQTGMTPDYSAPETFRGLFLAESDYYALGITLYELFCGHTPYSQLQGEELERILSIQNIPMPDNMPDELKALITGLTYSDITHRKEKANPNRRWTYTEVKNWCEGISQPLPGTSASYSMDAEGAIRPYRFLGQSYTDAKALVHAFNQNWEDGKKQLFRGLLSEHYKKFDPEIAGVCMDAEEEAERGEPDLIFFRVLYSLDRELRDFLWKGRQYHNLEEVGSQLLDNLRKNDTSMNSFIDEILNKGVMSSYMEIQGSKSADDHVAALKAFESKRRSISRDAREMTIDNYQLAYTLSGKRELIVDKESFSDPNQLSLFLCNLLNKSVDLFNAFCERLISDNDVLDVQFESWLISLGNREKISQWRLALQQ